jgi:lauroyl/myristoyl acyltransferase
LPGNRSLSLRHGAGRLAAALILAVRALPPQAAWRLLSPLLPLYVRLRSRHARRLEALFAATPFRDRLTLEGYYRRRLDLLLRCLRLHGAPLDPGRVEVEGMEHYRAALAGGRPVALVGLHAGVVELLHRLPEAAGRPFRILTAAAFAPPLTELLRRGRERDDKRVLDNRAPGPGLREVLAKRGVLALMADQVPGPGAPALRLWDSVLLPWPERLLAFLMEKGCVLLPVSTRVVTGGPGDPEGRSRYRFHVPWELAPGEDRGEGLARRLRDFLEKSVAEAPDQWNWSYPGLRPVNSGSRPAS